MTTWSRDAREERGRDGLAGAELELAYGFVFDDRLGLDDGLVLGKARRHGAHDQGTL